jgi:hypothetical protein
MVGIVNRLRNVQSGLRIPATVNEVLSPPKAPDALWNPLVLLFSEKLGSISGGKTVGK